MTCKFVRERLSDFIDGELSEIEHLQVEHHLVKCLACAEEADQLRHVVSLLRNGEEVEVPDDFREKLCARLTALRPATTSPKRITLLPLWRRWGVPAAAAAAAAALMFARLQPQVQMPGVAAPVPAVQTEVAHVPSSIGKPNPTALPDPSLSPPAPPVTEPGPAPDPGVAEPIVPADQGQPEPNTQVTAPPEGESTPAPDHAAPAQPEYLDPNIPGGPARVASNKNDQGLAEPGTMTERTYYARLQVTTLKDIDAQVATVAQAHDARVVDQKNNLSSGGRRSVEFILSMPTDKLAALQAALPELGTVLPADSPTSVDITGRYNTMRLDLQSREEAVSQYQAYLGDPNLSPEMKAEYQRKLVEMKEQIQKLTEDLNILAGSTRNSNLKLTIDEARAAFTGE